MAWHLIYHPDVQQDLIRLGSAAANRVLDVIEERIRDGEPDKLGKPLRGALAGCRRIRTRNTRIDLTAWNAIIGLRNRIVHDYLNLDMDRVLQVVSERRHHFIRAFLVS